MSRYAVTASEAMPGTQLQSPPREKGSGAMTMADLRPSDKATAPRQESEHARLAAIRAARRDLITVPAMPVKTVTISELGAYRKCAGCDRRVHGQAFADAHGWLWCERCATSDVIGAALTKDEALELACRLYRGETLARLAMAGQLSAPGADVVRGGPERDSMAAMLADLRADQLAIQKITRANVSGGPVPNPYGLAF